MCYPIKPASKVSIHNSSNGTVGAWRSSASGLLGSSRFGQRWRCWNLQAKAGPHDRGEKSVVGWPWDLNIYTLLESKILVGPWKWAGPHWNVIFQAPSFRGYFSFRNGKGWECNKVVAEIDDLVMIIGIGTQTHSWCAWSCRIVILWMFLVLVLDPDNWKFQQEGVTT